MGEMKVLLYAICVFLAFSGCATIIPPTVALEMAEVHYISPLNGDGVQDSLSLAINLQIDPRAALSGYSVTVYDSHDAQIRAYGDSVLIPGFFERTGNALGLVKRSSIETPELIIWDGRSDTAQFVEDGTYSVILEAWDHKDNRASSDPIIVVVDNTPPDISLSVPYLLFSPNGDGSKDTLPIEQIGSSEDLWSASIFNSTGELVTELTWEGLPAGEHAWTGNGTYSELLPDGLYRYEISSTDRAGNVGLATIENIGINTLLTPVSVATDRNAFSPNGDGIAEEIAISLLFQEENLDGWTLDIFDSADRRIVRRQGTTAAVQIWNGTTDAGEMAADGEYFIEFSAVYRNGNSPKVKSQGIFVDTEYPHTTASADFLLFSPDDDGYLDTISFFHRNSSDEVEWVSEVLDKNDKAVMRRSWTFGRPAVFIWDGINVEGAVVPDGTYSYRISSVDEAGNTFARGIAGIVVDNRPTAIDLEVSPAAISPNGDGISDTVSIKPSLSLQEGIVGWIFRIRDAEGSLVRRISEVEIVPLEWGGLTDDELLAPDGLYSVEYEAIYLKGNRPIEIFPLVLDTMQPEVAFTTEYTLFSPDADGRRDEITVTVTRASIENFWQAEFSNESREVVRSYAWDERPYDFSWDGRIELGGILPDGLYNLRIWATDPAGNTGGSELRGIRIDTRRTPVSIRTSVDAFSPNGDSAQESVTFYLDAGVSDNISDWAIEISNNRGEIVRRFSRDVWIKEVTWDGFGDNGKSPIDGDYRAELIVEYEKGDVSSSPSGIISVDTVFPTAEIDVDYLLFSPNGDGRRDGVPISHQNATAEHQWIGSILNATGTEVRRYTWNGEPNTFSWDGRTSSGRVAADGVYEYRLSATDLAGNSKRFEIPGITVDNRSTSTTLRTSLAAFSPNGDNVKDAVDFLLSALMSEGVARWEIQIKVKGGRTVRRYNGNEWTHTRTWDGRTSNGSVAPDGAYSANLTVEYEKGDVSESSVDEFLIDTVYPSAIVGAEYMLFSPNEDGRRDEFPVRQQNASAEAQWNGVFLDESGAEVRRFTWPDQPVDFFWDGRTNDGDLAENGDYLYRLSATDAAGNAKNFEIPGIRVDTRPTPVSLRASADSFSPNGDGAKDFVTFFPDGSLIEEIIAWELVIFGSNDSVVRSFSGDEWVSEMQWDGKSAIGTVVPDGSYSAAVTVEYRKGDISTGVVDPIVVDTEFPSARVFAEFDLFSPEGDGKKDSVQILHRGVTIESRWVGEILDSSNAVVLRNVWEGRPTDFSWNGKTSRGRDAPNGDFSYRLAATDSAGNASSFEITKLTVDRRLTPVSIRAAEEAFSPNADRKKDSAMFVPGAEIIDGIVNWNLAIESSGGQVVRTFEGTEWQREITWDGRSGNGVIAPDGFYRAKIRVEYSKGNVSGASSPEIEIDTQFPTAVLSAENLLFSPNGDGRRDTVTMRQGEASNETRWIGEILDASGNVVWELSWAGRPRDFVWDGNSVAGTVAPDGNYAYRLSATDRAGNSSMAVLRNLRVDNRSTPLSMRVDSRGFSPNGDGRQDDLIIAAETTLQEEISRWRIEAINTATSARNMVRSGDTGAAPSSLRWDGVYESGTTISDGAYRLAYIVEYKKGDIPETLSDTFIVDTASPSLVLNVRPTPFSPDDDGVDDSVSIGPRADDAHDVVSWSLEIYDPTDTLFKTFGGTGAPPREAIVWDGISDAGELVQAAWDYRGDFSAQDQYGNIAGISKAIPVDVYVIRDGDSLRIRVSSIYFAPNSPDFDEERREQNWQTLRRISEVLDKFPQYRITIEGHAVRVFWSNQERGEREEREELGPLSEQRAKTVKGALMTLGIAGDRMSTIGMGGTQPIVAHSDLENRWKNRRAEFILQKD